MRGTVAVGLRVAVAEDADDAETAAGVAVDVCREGFAAVRVEVVEVEVEAAAVGDGLAPAAGGAALTGRGWDIGVS